MHYGEHAIQAHYLLHLVFLAIGFLFIIIYPVIANKSKRFGITSLVIGAVILILSIVLLIITGINTGEGLTRLFQTT